MMCLWLNFIEAGGWFCVCLVGELLITQPPVVLLSSLSLLEKSQDLRILILGQKHRTVCCSGAQPP